MKILSCLSLIVSICLFSLTEALAWEEKVTHRDLSEFAAQNSSLNKNNGVYLQALGFREGLTPTLTWKEEKKIIGWLQEGAKLEDEGTNWEMITNVGRSNNHFHNPLSPSWANAGLNDDYTLGEIVYNVVGQSALLWAQDPAKQGAFRGDASEWDWSWQTIRAYYYMALTSKTENDKEVQI